MRDFLRRCARFILPGWLWLQPTMAEVRIAIVALEPDEPADLAAKRTFRTTAPVERRRIP
jgi:hypothetical protein